MTDWREKYLNKVTCGDCLELMRDLPDGCVDAVVTDPPYGKRPCRGKNGFGTCHHLRYEPKDDKWDKLVSKPYIDSLLRVGKNQVVWGGAYYTNYLPPSNCWLIWDKLMFGASPYADLEMAWTNYNSVSKIYRLRHCGFVTDVKDGDYHPTQKPIELMEWVLSNYTPPDAIILDPFIGSGTTAVAAIRTGRQFIGFEIDPHYCEIANRRIADEQAKIPIPFKEYEKPEQTALPI